MLRILPWSGCKVRCIDVFPWEGNSRQKVGYKVSRQSFDRTHPDFFAVALRYSRAFGNDIVL